MNEVTAKTVNANLNEKAENMMNLEEITETIEMTPETTSTMTLTLDFDDTTYF
jgi:hypothetical protein